MSCGNRTHLSDWKSDAFADRPRTPVESICQLEAQGATEQEFEARERIDIVVRNREPPSPFRAILTGLLQSAQWESNPHFRHGKAAGYRYIMGAKMHHYQIVKDQ